MLLDFGFAPSPGDYLGSGGMTERKFAGGWATTYDGECIPLSEKDAMNLWEESERRDTARRALMPDSLTALQILHDALTRLRDEGWREGMYCPKDSTDFAVIQYGSTGIFKGRYIGEWPKGSVWISDCSESVKGLLWKPLDDLTPAERDLLDKCEDAEKRMIEAEHRAMAALSDSFGDSND